MKGLESGKHKQRKQRKIDLNYTVKSGNLTQQWLQRYGWEILPHPAHSPDLAPSDLHLFGPLKRHLGGMAFETEDDLISELRNWFDNLDVDFFRVGINSLLSRWQNASISTGITLRSSGRVNFNLFDKKSISGLQARICEKRVPADLRVDSLATVPPKPREGVVV
ncbi:histone-lysine N-methyltransferase SETMAR [Plakobranchus ocellatus]|uniref:Histone-lysine N-methyltransferase SETMAR n=1 Tax=Plakobranchus ocellatus TaxID=259542 RepID=A0AAV4C6V5_9GAST|nr:histone-lysine N-methyltransferase SETMAR [Plakobranchus ocellatus]